MVNTYTIIFKLLILSALGFVLCRRKVLNEDALKFLTDFLIRICVPCLIFTNLIAQNIFQSKPGILFFIALSIVIFLVGLVIGIAFSALTREKMLYRETIALVSFQNCGYLPMNIVYFLFASTDKEKLLTFIFLYILGFNILMWSVGSFFIFKRKNESFDVKSLLNPPVLAIIISLILKKLLPSLIIPDILLSPMKMLGQMSFVLSMIVLGAGLSKSGFLGINKKVMLNIISISSLKLILIPFIFVMLVVKLKIIGILGLFIVLEACMPSAASLPIVTKWKGANYGYSSQIVFFTHLFSLITIPFWLNTFSSLKY